MDKGFDMVDPIKKATHGDSLGSDSYCSGAISPEIRSSTIRALRLDKQLDTSFDDGQPLTMQIV